MRATAFLAAAFPYVIALTLMAIDGAMWLAGKLL